MKNSNWIPLDSVHTGRNVKRALAGLAASAMVLGTMAPAAWAATSPITWGQKQVSLNGTVLASPYAYVSNGTTYFPVYYLQKAIPNFVQGATVTWDGTNLDINVPGLDTHTLQVNGVGVGANGIYINGVLVQRFTKQVNDDHNTTIATSFAPIYDLFLALNTLGMQSQWLNGGTEWNIVPPAATSAANLKISGNTILGIGDITNLSLTASTFSGSPVPVDPRQVTWSVNRNGIISPSGSFAGTTPGVFTVTATYEGQSTSTTIGVYGQPASVQLSEASSSVMANGVSTDILTANVVDGQGNPVSNFNGTATITGLTYGKVIDANGVATTTATFVNGVATLTLQAPTTSGESDTLSLTGLTPTNGLALFNVNSSSLTINYVAQTASQLSLTPLNKTVSANTSAPDNFTVMVNDSTGHPVTSGLEPSVTLTLTGPGSFQSGGTPVTTLTESVPLTASGLSVPVYAVSGQTGTITLTATSPSLTTATASISAVQTGAPATFTLTSSQGTVNAAGNNQAPSLAAGTPFTLYTAQLVDSNGNVVVPTVPDYVSISDNSLTTGGTLAYYQVANGQPVGGPYTPSQLQAAFNSANGGVVQFAIVNTAMATSKPTIKVSDVLTSTTRTATYTFATSSPAYAVFSGDSRYSLNAATSTLAAGQSATYTVSLLDVNGNPLAVSGQAIDVYFDGTSTNTASAAMNGSSNWSAASPLVLQTNAQGQVTVNVAVPAGTTGGSFTIDASVPSSSNASKQAITVSASPSLVNRLAFSNAAVSAGNTLTSYEMVTLPATMTVGQTLVQNLGLANVYVVPQNALGQVANITDSIQITSSNPSVIAISGATNGSLTQSAYYAMPTITAVASGTATLTVWDTSNPTPTMLTYTITVAPSVP